jgi:hypothetical protein
MRCMRTRATLEPSMSSPILLTGPQFLAIVNAAAALCPLDRDQFLAAVAAELREKMVGDGSVHRAIRAAQSKFPHPEPEPVPPRWARERPRFEKISRQAV